MNSLTIFCSAMVFFILCCPMATAVDEPSLVTDRPDFTESAETVPRGGFQLEFGYSFSKDGDIEAHGLGELLLRAALGGHAELRVGLNSWVREDGPAFSGDGVEDSYLGAKFRLAEAPDQPGGLRPGVALLVGSSLPTGSEKFGEDRFQPDATLALAWDLTERTALSSNIGYAYASEDDKGFNELSGSLSLGYGLTDDVGCYIEYYQFIHTEDVHDDPGYINGGLTWLTVENFQLDWRAGYQVAGDGNEFFTGIGATWRWLRQD